MIPFNKIPKGLRASLFFGELFLDGDSLGSSSLPDNGISCMGAIDSVTVDLGIYYNGETGGTLTVYNDETDDYLGDVQGYMVNPGTSEAGTLARVLVTSGSRGDLFFITEEDMTEISLLDDPLEQSSYHQRFSIVKVTDSPLRLRFELQYAPGNQYSRTTLKVADPINSTYFIDKATESIQVSKVCLA